MLFYLREGEKLVRRFGLKGIRLSTRPDALDGEKMELLLAHGVTAVELGAQSFDPRVLQESRRGHTAVSYTHLDVYKRQDEGYPERLREIYDPPAVLYLRGEIDEIDRQIALAVVGTRNHSEYGWRAAETLARGLASVGVRCV